MFINKSEKIAISWHKENISYNELLNKIYQYSELIAVKDSKIVIFSENRPEWIFAFYSIWKNNCIVVPIDFMSTSDEISYILNDCLPKVIFCSQSKLSVMEKALESVKYTPQIIQIENIEKKSLKYETVDLSVLDTKKTAVIIYTSGTTGSPKGVMLSFDNLIANIVAVSKGVKIYSSAERVMILLPLHHIFPLLGTMIAPLMVGAKVAISPSMKSEDILTTLSDNKITILIGVPRLYTMIRKGIMGKINKKKVALKLFLIAQYLNSRLFSKLIFKSVHKKFGGHLKYLVCGGAAIDPFVAKDYKTLGFEMLEGYGMTESSPMITFTRPGNVVIGSAGQAVPSVKMEIRDGEIVASGPNIMQGYFNRPDETKEVLKNGWLYTGDLGRIDAKGCLFVTGRKKEIIVLSNGKNINPVELEFKIASMTDYIREIAVFHHDEILQAVIFPDLQALQQDGISDFKTYIRKHIINFFNNSVSAYKKIMKITFVNEELPKTRLEKVRRFLLPELVDKIEEIKNDENIDEFEEFTLIRDFLKEQKERDIYPQDHLEIDVALDSLDKISLITFIKSTFGIDMKEEQIMFHQTVLNLSKFIEEKKEKISIETVNWTNILKEKVKLKLPSTWITNNIIKNLSFFLFKTYFRFSGEGISNLPQSPFIIVPNHQSFFDGLFVASLLKNKLMKNTYFYAKKKHIKNKFVKFIADTNNVVVIDIEKNVKESIQKLAEILRTGRNIIIFPEGTRSKDGKLGDFKKTFAILSLELNVPIVPVTINGAFAVLPKGSKFPIPFKKISVIFHRPIFPQNHTYESLKRIVQEKVSSYLE